MKYELWYSVVVRDRHGKVVSRERRRSRSFLEQFNQLVYVQMRQTSYPMLNTDGDSRSGDTNAVNFWMAGAGILYGIRVGTGNTPVAIDDYALEAAIESGTGAGQMEYQTCTVATSVVAAPSCSFVVSRSLMNNSPAEITVREAGIYVKMGAFPYYVCVTRDVFDTPQAVPISGSITIDWTIQVTV